MESIKSCSITPETQQDHESESRIFSICARAGVSCIGIQRGFELAPDYVLFQPVVTSLAIPLAEFADPDRAIALIQAKLAQAGAKCREQNGL
ncbi:MAG: hypothetical protein DMG32_07615 [Acidobacteria bacterium]|nr:MAG: hypothetical protein DMG32_07615 [Acidobacteriota bacterium]